MNYQKYPPFPHPIKKNKWINFKKKKFIEKGGINKKFKILEYSKNSTGWTDELTEMASNHIDINHPIDVASRELCLDLLDKYENSSKKVILEIGCSSGNLIKEIKKKKKYNYIGSDAIGNHLHKLSKKHCDIPFLLFDLLKNPFKQPMANAVIMLNVLEHIKNDNRALYEANKILHKNGILIIEVPSGRLLYDNYDKQLLHYRRYNMNEIVKKIEKAGFIVQKKTHIGFIIFPIFIIVKLFSKLFKTKNESIVIKKAKLSNNNILKFLFKIEKKLRNYSLPFGIRCYICAKKK